MRAIALAIILTGGGIEMAIRREKPSGRLQSFFITVFFICLIFGW
jgi:hypothetical protein